MAYKTLALGTQAAASAVTVYTIAANATVAVYSLVLTNTTSANITVDVSVNDSSTTRLIKTVVIPSGSGKCVSVPEIVGGYSANHSFILTPTTANSFNYLMTGNEV